LCSRSYSSVRSDYVIVCDKLVLRVAYFHLHKAKPGQRLSWPSFTLMGMRVTACARLAEVEGRRLRFRIEAHDDREKVGEAIHLRVVINPGNFGKRAGDKISHL
jgi:hypothetical protein